MLSTLTRRVSGFVGKGPGKILGGCLLPRVLIAVNSLASQPPILASPKMNKKAILPSVLMTTYFFPLTLWLV